MPQVATRPSPAPATGKGWGRSDIDYACEERRGSRFAIGFPLPADRGEGKIAGYTSFIHI